MHALTFFIRLTLAVLAAGFFSRPNTHAQVVLGPPRETPAAAAPRATPSTSGQPGSLATIKSALTKEGPLAQWGPLAVRPYTAYSIIYGNGILRVPGEPVNTYRQTFSQGLLLELGSTWTLDGNLGRSIYSSRLLDDTYESSIRASGKWAFRDWKVGIAQSWASNSPLVTETGGQNSEKTAGTSATVSYESNSKTSWDTSVAWTKRKAAPRLKNAAWTGSDWSQSNISSWLNYRASSHVSVSLGLLAGYDDVSDNPNMAYTQPQARLRWTPTEKLTFGLSGGVENRKTEGMTGKSATHPVVDASASYRPTLTTTVSLSASRSINTSYFNDQTIRNDSWNINVSQRLLQRYFATASYSRGQSAYDSTTTSLPGLAPNRRDQFDSISTGISTVVLKRASVSLSYQYSRNTSGISAFQFSSRQIGADFSYRF